MPNPRRTNGQGDEPYEGPSLDDVEAFSGVTRTCPECHSEVYDQAELCWKCGHAFSGESKPLPKWVVVVGVIVLAGLLIPILRSCF